MGSVMIDVARDFSRFPAGRFRTDGPFSGQRFREDLLVPALKQSGRVTVRLDGAMGFGSSFLEEAFGGLVRNHEYTAESVLEALSFEASDPSLVDEIREYISATKH